MKKSILIVVGMLCLGFLAHKAFAGNQYNWGSSNGNNWVTPDDTKATAGQVLQIGNSGGSIVTAAGGPLTLFSASSTTIAGLTPATTGQLIYCNNCSNYTPFTLCASTGILSSQWAVIFSSASGSALSVCK